MTSLLWPIVLRRREFLAGAFYQIAYECWLEEEIDAGRIQFPGGLDAFIAQRGLVTRADWRGPPKPQADDLKYAKAVQTLDSMGVTTMESICADLGTDWEDVLKQQKRERDMRKELGLPDPHDPPDDPIADRLATEPDDKGP